MLRQIVFAIACLPYVAGCDMGATGPQNGLKPGDGECPEVEECPDCPECPEPEPVADAVEAGCLAGQLAGTAWGTHDGSLCTWTTARDPGWLPDEPIEWWTDFADAWPDCFADAYGEAFAIEAAYAGCAGF